jgi:hypothetical protein
MLSDVNTILHFLLVILNKFQVTNFYPYQTHDFTPVTWIFNFQTTKHIWALKGKL